MMIQSLILEDKMQRLLLEIHATITELEDLQKETLTPARLRTFQTKHYLFNERKKEILKLFINIQG